LSNYQGKLLRLHLLVDKSFNPCMSLNVSLPEIVTQRAIVTETERTLSILAGIETDFDINVLRADRLLQSILKKAFSGQLIAHSHGGQNVI